MSNELEWTLFLDDERSPTPDLELVEIARDCDEAIALVEEFGLPTVISFDHDLGRVPRSKAAKPVATNFLHWLIEQDLDGKLELVKIKRIVVHSANFSGASNIIGLWDSYAKVIGSEVRAERRPRRTLID